MIKQNTVKFNLIVLMLVIIVLLNIFHSKPIPPWRYTSTNNRDEIRSIESSEFECLQQQNIIKKRIDEHCSKVQVCLYILSD